MQEKRIRAKGYTDPCECTCGGRFCAGNRVDRGGQRAERAYVANNQASRKRDTALQAELLEKSSRRYAPWSGEELDIVMRDDVPLAQIANLLGRTMWAVRTKRRNILREPKLQRVIEYKGHQERLPEIPPESLDPEDSRH